jgi:hypothetical protein
LQFFIRPPAKIPESIFDMLVPINVLIGRNALFFKTLSMRKYISLLFIVAFAITSQAIYACEICGCGVGNFYMGLLPNFENKFIGIRYQFMRYHTQITDNPSEFSDDYYKTVELWSGWNIGKKWRVMTFIPYQINEQHTDDGDKKQHGLGDITLLANYSIFHKYDLNAAKKTTEQQLWIGGGIKLPTGKYQLDMEDPDANLGDVNAQMGTGSVDFLLSTSYNISFQQAGVSTSLNYKINTTNNDDYYFGNRFYGASAAYYKFRLKDFSVAPNAGILYEHAASNYLENEKVDQTGGYAAFLTTGAEFSFKRIATGINLQTPFSQNFAEGQTTAKLRGVAHLTLAF